MFKKSVPKLEEPSKPKFDLFQKVWRLSSNKATEVTIFGISLDIETKKYQYSFTGKQSSFGWWDETEFYATKEALIASL